MSRNVLRYYKRLIGPVVTTTVVILATAGTALGQPVEDKKVTASDGDAGDAFGQAVWIDGDTAVIGAYFADHDGPPVLANAGSAYIFQEDWFGARWGEVAILRAEFPDAEDRFGASVSISVDTAIVGAPRDDGAGTDLGAAYIFDRDEGGNDEWDQVVKIIAPDADPDDQFGWSVSINGSIAIVGAPFVGSDVGEAYIYYRDRGGLDNWGWVATLTASDGARDDVFGWSVAVNGDLAIVGAPFENENGTNAGAAYVFGRDEGGTDNWGEVKKITAGDLNDEFGVAVAMSVDTALVGAENAGLGGTGGAGAAYVFEQDAGGTDNWGQVAKLTASDGAVADAFGLSVSIRRRGAVVGAFGNNLARGAAYLFRRPGGGWVNNTENDKMTASDAAPFDAFGRSVAISGDFAVMGAPGEDANGSSSGSGYVFESVCPCPWDLTGNDKVGAVDLLILLSAWGTDPGGPPDFDDSGFVGSTDLLALLVNWGLCPCVEGTPPLSLEDEMAEACLTMDDWDEFEAVMTDPESSQEDKDRYECWMRHYLEDCSRCICTHPPVVCPSPDPFG
ncbi:MAG: FG-GAP repeat protein [Phycisphaerales bacterium]